MTEAVDMFAALDGATATATFPKLRPGAKYRLDIQRTLKGEGFTVGANFVIESRIVECLNPAYAAEFFPGKEISCTINRLWDQAKDKRELAQKNLINFLAAAFSDFEFPGKGKMIFNQELPQQWGKLANSCTAAPHTLLKGCNVYCQVDLIHTARSKKSQAAGVTGAALEKEMFALHTYSAVALGAGITSAA